MVRNQNCQLLSSLDNPRVLPTLDIEDITHAVKSYIGPKYSQDELNMDIPGYNRRTGSLRRFVAQRRRVVTMPPLSTRKSILPQISEEKEEIKQINDAKGTEEIEESGTSKNVIEQNLVIEKSSKGRSRLLQKRAVSMFTQVYDTKKWLSRIPDLPEKDRKSLNQSFTESCFDNQAISMPSTTEKVAQLLADSDRVLIHKDTSTCVSLNSDNVSLDSPNKNRSSLASTDTTSLFSIADLEAASVTDVISDGSDSICEKLNDTVNIYASHSAASSIYSGDPEDDQSLFSEGDFDYLVYAIT